MAETAAGRGGARKPMTTPDRVGVFQDSAAIGTGRPIGTRVSPPLGKRLRVYAAVHGRTVAEVVSDALDSYLPPLADLVRVADGGLGVADQEAGPGTILAVRGQAGPGGDGRIPDGVA